MKNQMLKYFLFATLVVFWGCSEDDGGTTPVTAPTEADAAFTFAPTAENDNIIEYTATNEGFIYNWDFGNGTTSTERVATATYPSAGTYEVTLTVRNQEGSASSSQDVVIAETDPTLLDNPLYNLLTGGVDGGGMKTWAVDSASSAHFGVGPSASNGDYQGVDYPTYYEAAANEKVGAGFYNDRYTFNLEGFGFDMETQGDIYLNAPQEANFPGAFDPGVGDLTAPFEPSGNLTWNLSVPAEGATEGDTTLTISADGFIGYYTGVQTYKIISITENELFLQFADAANDDLFWYVRLVPEGFDSNPGGEPEVVPATLPLGFETQTPTLTSFEGNVATIIDNPDASGINPSAKVLELVKGFQGFSGTFFQLANPVTIGATTSATLKVWAPVTGVFRFKLEVGGDFIEVDATVDTAEEWVELTFDLSTDTERTLSQVVLFPSWDVPDAGTFYVDDINIQQ